MGLFDIIASGINPILGEDTVARLPVVNGLLGAESDSQKALIKKQEQLDAEAKKREQQNVQARMRALGQSMLAFNPQNQMMAQMFGPQAAFSPQQFAQMTGDPGARSEAEYKQAHAKALEQPWAGDRRLSTQGWSAADIQRMQENEKRKKMIAQQMTPLGPGPAPLNLPPAAAARRY
jgi:hypothetical protein